MVYPKYKNTFWSFEHALSFISKKAAFPPLGLLTVASMLPKNWNKKLIDMNVKPLTDKDIKWADYVFMSAMITQKKSVKEVIDRCKHLGTKIVAGGPSEAPWLRLIQMGLPAWVAGSVFSMTIVIR